MKKTVMMRTAHRLARVIVAKTGNYQIALSFALKYVWKRAKAGKKVFGRNAMYFAIENLTTSPAPKNVFGVPAWIIEKNLSQDEAYAVLNETNSTAVVRETEKAELVKFDTEYGYVQMWTPKSVLVAA